MPKERRGRPSFNKMTDNAGQANFSQARTHTQKRNRYVLHACDRCRTAKVRCDGGLPCGYCVRRDRYTCYYSSPKFQSESVHHATVAAHDNEGDNTGDNAGDNAGDNSGGFQNSMLTLLQRQSDKLDFLVERAAVMDKTHGVAPNPPSVVREVASTPLEQPLPIFQSSTSSLFCIGVIESNLRVLKHDYTNPLPPDDNVTSSLPLVTFSIVHGEFIDEVSNEIEGGESKNGSIFSLPRAAVTGSQPTQTKPLDDVDCNDLISLIHVYQNLAGILYPILNVECLIQQARYTRVTRPVEGTSQKRRMDSSVHSSLNQVKSNDVGILKMVAAIALLAEDETRFNLASSLYESLLPDIEAMIWSTKVDFKGLILLTLVSLFHVHQNKWRLAWRFLGNVTRIILELGLNRQTVLERSFTSMVDRTQAINAIWTVFVLNRVLSYSLGLAEAMQDLHLDPSFSGPVNAPYLEAMIEYARIACPAIDALMGDKNVDRQETFAFFQYRLDEWGKRISTDFQFLSSDDETDKWNQDLRTLLHLRENYLRTVVARAFICDNLCTAAPLDIWASSVDAAADTIQRLSRLDISTKTYRFHQPQYDYFLIAALGILLLAITQESSSTSLISPREQRIPMAPTTCLQARQNSMVALNLLYTLASSSRQSQYLWQRVRGVACRLNLLDHLAPGLSRTEASVLENKAPTRQSPSANDVTMEPVRGAGSYTFEGVDIIPLDWQDMTMSLLNTATCSLGTDVNQDLGVLFEPSFFANI